MLINLYIEVPDQLAKSNLLNWLSATDYAFFDGTDYDSLCTGPCKVLTLSEVVQQLKGDFA